MSREMVDWAQGVEGLDPVSRMVLVSLAKDADRDGRVVVRENTAFGVVGREYFLGPHSGSSGKAR